MLITTPDVTSIDALLSCWERAEYIAEAFVILGCVGEFVAEFTDIVKLEWRHRFSKVSLLVLIAALAVELGALAKTNNLAEQEIALLNKSAEQERLAGVKIEETVAWRRLNSDQQTQLSSDSSASPDKLQALCTSRRDKEAETLCSEVAKALHDAGWTVFAPAGFQDMAGSGLPYGSVPPLETGVTVTSTADTASREAANAVVKGLNELGSMPSNRQERILALRPLLWWPSTSDPKVRREKPNSGRSNEEVDSVCGRN